MIEGGYYIKARKIQNSDISTCPPYVREIWDWLLKEANHSPYENIKRGQMLRTFHDIIDGLKWFIGYRKMAYSKSQCENAMRWLRKHGMIATTKTTRGLIITICNYDLYQDPKNYDNNTKAGTRATMEQQPPATIYKNGKEEEEEKECKEVIIGDKKKSPILYQKFIDVYFDFIKNINGVPPKFDGAEGKNIKRLILTITQKVKVKTPEPTDQNILDAWIFILNSRDLWPKFQKDNLKVQQIYSDIDIIINSIRNGKSGDQKTTDKDIDDILEGVFSDSNPETQGSLPGVS